MKLEDVVGFVILYTFAAVAVIFPLYVIIRSVINFARATDGRGTIVIKALVSLGIWAFLSFTFVMIAFMYVFEVGDMADREAASRRMTILTIVLTVIYIAVGLVMAYWVRLQPGWRTLHKTRRGI
jgi:hypothetical protein